MMSLRTWCNDHVPLWLFGFIVSHLSSKQNIRQKCFHKYMKFLYFDVRIFMFHPWILWKFHKHTYPRKVIVPIPAIFDLIFCQLFFITAAWSHDTTKDSSVSGVWPTLPLYRHFSFTHLHPIAALKLEFWDHYAHTHLNPSQIMKTM